LPSDVFFQVQDAPKPVFGRGSASDPCAGAYDAPPDSYLVRRAYFSSPKEAEARQTCPGFFSKSLLESGNLLDLICRHPAKDLSSAKHNGCRFVTR